jgi:hypothetical protein
MNTPAYRKAYMANLKLEISNNNKNAVANKAQPANNQFIQNTGQPILGVSTFKGETGVQAKGTKFNGFK